MRGRTKGQENCSFLGVEWTPRDPPVFVVLIPMLIWSLAFCFDCFVLSCVVFSLPCFVLFRCCVEVERWFVFVHVVIVVCFMSCFVFL